MSAAAIILRLLAGIALGVFFYGGLKFTVRQIATTRHPVLWTLGSMWARFGATIGAFWVLTSGRWEFALILLAGFTIGRFVCM
jgi:F1F0 ATPase subunit 2